jgi:phospholipid/cholesterol/gamma-HCH transport system substrate-binding protein
MERRASYLLVGGFVLVLIAAIFGFGLWLARTALDRDVDVYRVCFTGSVTGLQVGSAVRYRGVLVGTVESIRIDPTNVERVEVTVALPADLPLKSDVVAQLEPQGVTGQAYVQITGGTQAAADLEPGPDGVRVIASRPSSISEVVERAPELLQNLIRVSQQLQGILSPGNVAGLSESLENVRRLTGGLADASQAAAVTIGRADALLAEAAGTVGTLGEEAAGVLRSARRSIDTVGRSAETTATRLQGTADETVKLVGTLNRAAGRLDQILAENRQPIRDFTGTGMYEFSQLVSELRDLAANLSRLSVRIERNPTDFLLGGSRRGVEVQ